MLSVRAHTTAVYIAFVLLVGWILWQSSQYSATYYGGTSTEEHQSGQDADVEKLKTEKALTRYTGWLTFFTGVLAVATIGLGIATLGMYSLAREELLSTHRPKIRVKHFFLASDIWQGEPILVNMTLVNNGTAEAIPHQIGIKYFVVRKDRQLPIEPSITPIFYGTGQRMEVGKNLDIEKVDAQKTLDAEENDDIQQGRSRLFAVGYVSYEDVAGKTRITGFCRVLTFPLEQVAFQSNTRFRRFEDPDYEYED